MRKGFTLIELLIVVSVIAVLAGLLMPALSMVRAQANKLKCASNMRNIAVAVLAYRSDNNDTFPGRFSELVTGYNLPLQVLLCPVDKSHGHDPNMGRATTNWDDLSALFYLQMQGTPSVPPVTACSYDYECCGWVGATLDSGAPVLQPKDIAFFYQGVPGGPPNGVSWAMAKQIEQQTRNTDAAGNPGYPFPASSVPMIRCYHHYQWTGAGTDNAQVKVVNISLEGNLIYTIPYWEHAINPSSFPLE